MATGTEGPDYLVNDTSVEFDVINALGGDDTIEIITSSAHHVVTVSGGSGVDTLTVASFIWSASPGRIITGSGTFGPKNEVYYGGIERLTIQGIALSLTGGNPPWIPPSVGDPVFITTGDTIDYINITSSLRFADVHVSTGGGDDEIFLGDVGPFSSVNGGGGDDLIDLTGRPNSSVFTAEGGEGNDILLGGSGPDRLDGGAGDDFLRPGAGTPTINPWLNMTVVETAIGGAGNDVIYFGGYLDSTDRVDGGSETDRLVLQGDYGLGLVLVANSVAGIESVSLLSAGDDSFSAGGQGLYDYVLTTHDSNFAAGVQARIEAGGLLAGEDLTFNGSAETDARFLVYGGKGADRVTGGLGGDIFFFGDESRFAPGDVVNGGGGYDGLFLRGDYSIDFNAPGYAGALANLENLTLSSAADERFATGGDGEFDYYVAWADSLLGPGQTITISGGLLQANETLTFQGSAERDGNFRIFAGAADDQLYGGRGSDLFFGGLGADRMIGNGGNDVFRYDLAAESTSVARDTIRDFSLGDLIDLSRIDASTLAPGDQAFSFIGTAAFGNQAGELRLVSQGGPLWLVQGDTDGNGIADFELSLLVVDAHTITGADFFL
ncbi:MAG: calcium-binding protein [Allosphingosinicella sp.]